MITFKAVRWANFLSTGSQFTEVQLNRSSTTLIVGDNGAGKSTILDALCFGLFNKPFRNINKPQLVNSINGKECRVEIEFGIGSSDYRVIRTIKPNGFVIYKDDEQINQDADAKDYQKYLENQILKLNYKSFTQIVILGSASFTPFMQLSSIARRDLIEELLDLKVFSSMNEIVRERLSQLRSEINLIESKIEISKNKTEIQKEYINKLKDQKEKKKTDLLDQLEDKKNSIADLKKKINEEKIKITDEDKVIARESKLISLQTKINNKILRCREDIEFYGRNNTCPTCSQDLSSNTKNESIQKNNDKIKEYDAAKNELENQLQEVKDRLTEIREVSKVIISLKADLSSEKVLANKIEEELNVESIQSVDIKEEQKKLKETAQEVIELSKQKSSVNEDIDYYSVVQTMLKDNGIKTQIIKQYLPVMNKVINKYLQSMDFFASFELDESFGETIKSRHRDKFSYESFSEGEKQRIDLSLLFAWRHIAKTKNSTNTNLLILDEIFDSSLDSNGADLLYQILATLDKNTNTFVISHKDHMFDKFRSIIKFEKAQNFSRIAK